MNTFLVVDDDPSIAVSLRHFLASHSSLVGVTVSSTGRLKEALEFAPTASIIILDLTLLDSDSLRTLEAIEELRVHAPVVVITGDERRDVITTAIEKYGAAFAVFKSMLGTQGMEWFLLVISSLISQRLYRPK